MKNTRILAISIIIPLVAGGIGSLIGDTSAFNEMIKPSFAPPGFIFPIVWTVLYVLMGISSYMIYITNGRKIDSSLLIYFAQLLVNMLWPFFFFTLKWYLFAFAWIIILIALVVSMIMKFVNTNRTAAFIQLPYLLWLIFASVLNFSIYTLN